MKLCILFLLVFNIACSQQNSNVITMNWDQVKEYMAANNDYVLLDVRTEDEFSQRNLPDAINIDYYSDTFKSDIEKLPKDKTYIVYCRSGNRSLKTVQMMEEMQFKKLIHFKGGMISIN